MMAILLPETETPGLASDAPWMSSPIRLFVPTPEARESQRMGITRLRDRREEDCHERQCGESKLRAIPTAVQEKEADL
jgi:hypothetical protein